MDFERTREAMRQIARVADSMRKDGDLSAANKDRAERIWGIAEKELTAMGEADKQDKPGDSQEGR